MGCANLIARKGAKLRVLAVRHGKGDRQRRVSLSGAASRAIVRWERECPRVLGDPGPGDQLFVTLGRRRRDGSYARPGGLDLREVRPSTVAAMVDRLRAAGVSEPTIGTTLVVLGGMFRRGLLDEIVTGNPVRLVDKPSQRRTREPKLVAGEGGGDARVAARESQASRWARPPARRDPALAARLRRPPPRERSAGVALGGRAPRVLFVPAGRKRGARDRTVRLLGPFLDDLDAWRRVSGSADAGLVLGRWSGERWDGWRDRVYRHGAKAAGLAVDARPRDLRGSFASLLIAEGQSVLEVVRQLGHLPAPCLRDDAALFDDFDPAVRVDPAREIRARRAAHPVPMYLVDTQSGARPGFGVYP